VEDLFGRKLVRRLPLKQETLIREDEKPLALAMGRRHDSQFCEEIIAWWLRQLARNSEKSCDTLLLRAAWYRLHKEGSLSELFVG